MRACIINSEIYELGKLNAIYCNRATYLNIKLNTLCCLQNYKNLLYIVSY